MKKKPNTIKSIFNLIKDTEKKIEYPTNLYKNRKEWLVAVIRFFNKFFTGK